MTIWPVAAIRHEPGAPYPLRPPVAWTSALLTLCLVAWFTAELFGGSELGLAERAVTADQSLWPLIVVVSVLAARVSPGAGPRAGIGYAIAVSVVKISASSAGSNSRVPSPTESSSRCTAGSSVGMLDGGVQMPRSAASRRAAAA